MTLDYREQARELLRQQLMQNADAGVRAMAVFDPPEDSVARVAAALEARDRRNAN